MATNAYAPDGTRRERSIGELFGELARETGTLVKQEVQLAKTELSQKAAFAGKNAGVVGAGALVGVVAMITFAGALTLLLGLAMPLWASALIVTAVFGLVAYLLVRKGLSAFDANKLKPTQTIASIQDNRQWAQKQLH